MTLYIAVMNLADKYDRVRKFISACNIDAERNKKWDEMGAPFFPKGDSGAVYWEGVLPCQPRVLGSIVSSMTRSRR